MAANNMKKPAEGYVQTPYPVQGLPRITRHVTTHDSRGKSVFLSTDGEDHHDELVNKSALANILHWTDDVPVNPKSDLDASHAHQNEPQTIAKNGMVCRMVDFAPGSILPVDRVNSLDYAVVIEGVFKIVLDSGEERIIQRGDIVIQRSAVHRWINVTGNGSLPGRILFMLHDVEEFDLKDLKINGSHEVVRNRSAGLSAHQPAPPYSPVATVQLKHDYDYYESEL